jgi:hypothetical protein
MKTISIFTRKTGIAAMLTAALIFILNPLFSQDSAKKPSPKKEVKVIVKTDKDGKTSEFDTTFDVSGDMDVFSWKKSMKDFNIDAKGLADDIEEMLVEIRAMDLADSSKVDSITKMIKKIRIGKGALGRLGHRSGHPYSFDYDFDLDISGIPDPPPPPPVPDIDEDIDFNFSPDAFGWENKIQEKGNSLSDVLGDIPMDMVKSYSIKDKKNGKRIVIELNDNPVLRHQEKVIVIREPHRRMMIGHPGKKMRKGIIINPGRQRMQKGMEWKMKEKEMKDKEREMKDKEREIKDKL